MENERGDYHDRSPHFDGEREGIISTPDSPQMGIKIDADPYKKQNPNPFHLSDKGKKGINGFSNTFKGNED
jgi:hypothetical protein